MAMGLALILGATGIILASRLVRKISDRISLLEKVIRDIGDGDLRESAKLTGRRNRRARDREDGMRENLTGAMGRLKDAAANALGSQTELDQSVGESDETLANLNFERAIFATPRRCSAKA
jgi:methyl-accepting chemotaxis protein